MTTLTDCVSSLKLRAFYLMRSILVHAVNMFPAFAVGFALTMILGTIYLWRIQ